MFEKRNISFVSIFRDSLKYYNKLSRTTSYIHVKFYNMNCIQLNSSIRVNA